MYIIVEGPDGSGKSTLVEKLRREIRGQYVWVVGTNSRPQDSVDIDNYMDWVDCHILDYPLIMDRHPLISEYIYGPLFRGQCRHGLSLETIAGILDAKEALLIYCRPPSLTIHQHIHDQPQMAGIHENVQKLIDKYDEFMLSLEIERKIEYNWQDPRSKIVERVKDYIINLRASW